MCNLFQSKRILDTESFRLQMLNLERQGPNPANSILLCARDELWSLYQTGNRSTPGTCLRTCTGIGHNSISGDSSERDAYEKGCISFLRILSFFVELPEGLNNCEVLCYRVKATARTAYYIPDCFRHVPHVQFLSFEEQMKRDKLKQTALKTDCILQKSKQQNEILICTVLTVVCECSRLPPDNLQAATSLTPECFRLPILALAGVFRNCE
ncbi:hypothetical protein C0J52_25381 [Blattella germanica]|nr:hypothetical protein C0J52_25381 [Blattella germanica]